MNPPAVRFGQYKLIHEVAVGGMGEIFLASDTQMSRPVAIKRVLEKFRTRPDVSRMFEVEATIMSVLRHPNIVRVFESGELDGVFYISMEYIHGKTLRQLVDRSRELGESLPPSLVIEIVTQLARALAYAHGMKGRSGRPMGLVHRDVNPSNLLLGYDGSVKLIDFGIVQTDDELAPDDLEPKGKFAYMSPEQTRGQRVDLRSDLFSLGICLYEALTLYNPFIHDAKGASAVEAIQSHEPQPVSDRNRRLAPFDPIIARALAKSPADRFASGERLVAELESVGEQFKSFMPLSAFMADLFEAQKTEEDAILKAVELATSSTIMIGSSAPATIEPPPIPNRRTTSDDEAVPELIVETRGSAVAFASIALIIAILSLLASFSVYRSVIRDRLAQASALAPNMPSGVVTRRAPSQAKSFEMPSSDASDADADAIDIEVELGEPEDELPENAEPSSPSPPPQPSETRSEPATVAGTEAPRKRKRPLATLNITSDPEVRVVHGDDRIDRTDTVELFKRSGLLTLGRGRHISRDPFAVTLSYALEQDRLSLEIASEPWAIVRGPGSVTLGRTPVSYRAKSGTVTFELTNPRERRLMRIVVRFRPKRTS